MNLLDHILRFRNHQ